MNAGRVNWLGIAPNQALHARSTLKAPNYRQRKKQREDAKRKANEEKNQRKGRVPRPQNQPPPV
jgi:hypothetical protein